MKITMYELLGMIKDGKAPKRIKNEGHYYNYNELEKDYYEGMGYDYEYLFKNTPNDRLNDEVEIFIPTLNNLREQIGLPKIEQKKIPEKFKINYEIDEENTINMKEATMLECDLACRINEIIDYLKSKGE